MIRTSQTDIIIGGFRRFSAEGGRFSSLLLPEPIQGPTKPPMQKSAPTALPVRRCPGSNLRGLPFRTSALRGEGVPSKADVVSNLSKGGCVNLRTRGEGVKKSEMLADVLTGSPRTQCNVSFQERMTKEGEGTWSDLRCHLLSVTQCVCTLRCTYFSQ